MSTVASRLADAGLVLPAAPGAIGDYVPAVRAGELVFTSGQLPVRDGSLITSGLVGGAVALETAVECARQASLNALAAAATVCELDRVLRVVKVVGYVASSRGFTAQATVLNAASAVLTTAFGPAGRHAREAVGVARLPMDSPVEISAIFLVS